MRRTKTRRTAALLAFLLALAVLTPTLTLPVEAVKQSDIDALKEDANDLASQRKKLQERINALKSDKSKAIQQKELLDEQVDNTQAEINNVQRQIDTYTALIAQTEDELAEAERQEEAQYELFCARVRAMEERGDISYWAVLFRAESFTDMLSRLDAINELMDSDQAVIDRAAGPAGGDQDQAGGPGGAEGRGGERQGGAPAEEERAGGPAGRGYRPGEGDRRQPGGVPGHGGPDQG